MTYSSSVWTVEGGHQLFGVIDLKGSKNSALAILCASLLTMEPVELTNVPRISDIIDLVSVLRSVGSRVDWKNTNTLSLQRPSVLNVAAIDATAARRTRAIVLLIACFAMDEAAFTLPLPGGCQLGERSLGPHIDALRQLGLEVECYSDKIWVHRVRQDEPTVITLQESGDTVTENAILAAVATRRHRIQILNASCNYMVQDLCLFLQMLGVSITGVGTHSLTIGLCTPKAPGPIAFPILEDPIEAFFFVAAAVVTKSDLRIERVPFKFISLELHQLRNMGLSIMMGPQYLAANGMTELCDLEILAQNSLPNAVETKIHPNIFPFGVNVDNLPAFAPIAACSKGVTLLHDWMYEKRASYFAQLQDFGVQVQFLDTHRVCICGPTSLRATGSLLPPALRPASMILLTALAAPGVSRLENAEILGRGYEHLLTRLQSLGARVGSDIPCVQKR